MSQGAPTTDDAVIDAALEVYKHQGAEAAAVAFGTTARTVYRWAAERGVTGTEHQADPADVRRPDSDSRWTSTSYLAKATPIDRTAAALDVAARHGLVAAARWADVTVSTVVAWRDAAGGLPAIDTDPAVDLACTCQRCTDARSEEQVRSNIRYAGTRNTKFKIHDEPWIEDAACRGMDTEIFFPHQGDDTRPAKAVCDGCTVRSECLDYALRTGEHHGVWGGLSERERRKVRARAKRRRLAEVAAANSTHHRHDVA